MVKAHGLRGEVVVELYSGRPERARQGSCFTTSSGTLQVVQADRFAGRLPNRWIIRFADVDDRDAAEALRGVALAAPPLDEDGETLWVHQLVGAEVVERGGERVGAVAAVVANPASDLLELDGGGLIPLVFVVDRRGDGTLVVDLPHGLLA